jgi:hypothetical protein
VRRLAKLATEIAGHEASIDIPALGLSLPLTEIYRGIGDG